MEPETPYDILEKGDYFFFRGNRFKVLDVLPRHMMYEDDKHEPHLISKPDYNSLFDAAPSRRPRIVKYHDTDEYKKRVEDLEKLLKELEEEYRRDPDAFIAQTEMDCKR